MKNVNKNILYKIINIQCLMYREKHPSSFILSPYVWHIVKKKRVINTPSNNLEQREKLHSAVAYIPVFRNSVKSSHNKVY